MSPDISSSISAIEERLTETLGDDLARHCRGVAASARALAEDYGVDVDRAYLAGLLHDWVKGLSGEELLQESATRCLPVTDVDRKVPYLLHAQVAAARAKEEFPETPDDVIEAVARHTLGATGMTPLDMVIFVADMIEPDRDFAGVAALREMAGHASLPELFLAAYASSLIHVLQTRRHLHPQTVPTWNAAVDAAAGEAS